MTPSGRCARPSRRLPRALAVAALIALAAGPSAADETGPGTATEAARPARPAGGTGRALPRFASLRAGEVNLRTGPGLRYPIDWVYRRRDLPVEIIEEFEHWRRIRDWQGTVGWVHRSMLQGVRTARVVGGERLLRGGPSAEARAVARVEPGAIGVVEDCTEGWCRLRFEALAGWLERRVVYGVYPRELLD